MKKTLIALFALADMAMGADNEWEATFASTNGNIDQAYTDYIATFEESAPLTLTFTGLSLQNSGQSQANGTYNGAESEQYYTAIRPNANIGNGATWTLSFTITNTSAEEVKISNILLDTFAYNSSGGFQSKDVLNRYISFTLSGAAEASVVHSFTNKIAPTQGGDAGELHCDDNCLLSFTTPVVLGMKGSDSATASFTLTVKKSDSMGTFVGLTGMTVNAIPEPATATLSLLALAGLAGHRRRR